MKERPILFSAPMVRAILDGSKTQTRRVVKLQPPSAAYRLSTLCDSTAREDRRNIGKHYWMLADGTRVFVDGRPYFRCPHGYNGDRLWVRETIELKALTGNDFPSPLYVADGAHVVDREGRKASNHEFIKRRVTPSIHMPRWASRITLEITAVRVEQLQAISRGDCMAEGCPFPNLANETDPKKWYAEMWDSINGPGAWDKNPFVWVIEFKRVIA